MESLDEQLIREAVAAWNRGDWDAVLEHCHPEIEWRGATQLLDLPAVSYGHEGVREFWRLWTDSWTDINAELEEIIEIEGGMLALIRWRARPGGGPTGRVPVRDPRPRGDPLRLLLGAQPGLRGARTARPRMTSGLALPLHAGRP